MAVDRQDVFTAASAALPERLWWLTAAAFMALFAVTLVAWHADARTLGGSSVWAKPLKFQLSLALHFATLALITRYLSADFRVSQLLTWVAFASIFAAGFEIVYIMAQAGQQALSHFNLTTPFHRVMYALMAIGAVVILLASATVGAAAALDGKSDLPRALRHAIAIGLIGGTILTLITAFTIGSRLSPHVGVEPQGAARFPFTGWSLTIGDLRVPHFFATHMMQAVPLAGLAAVRLLPPVPSVYAVCCAAAVWAALTLALYVQALAGQPIYALPAASAL